MKTFFFHIGYQPYLDLAVRHAALKNDVVVIGDEQNKTLGEIEQVTHFLLSDYDDEIDRFLDNYQHLHTGGRQFEEWCFMRWIAVRNVARSLNIDSLFYGDSDNLIFSHLGDVYEDIGRPSLALSVPKEQPAFRHAATGEVSYWSLKTLERFCDYIFMLYEDPFEFRLLQEKWNWHKINNLPGGICDMTALWHFTRREPHLILTDVLNGSTTFDHSINNSSNYYEDEYQFADGVKKIEFHNEMPYCFNNMKDCKVMFHNLQFQGNSKHLMKNYAKNITSK
jgi:hypothetical protein